MKNLFVVSALLLIIVTITSCKEKEKKATKSPEKVVSIDAEATSIYWTAYKTTNKVPVKGQFTKVSIETITSASTAVEALNGLKFNIPVSSLFTKDTIRDGKLKKFFFGTMQDTNLITGTLMLSNETTGAVQLTMNGITKALPITVAINANEATLSATMDLDNWQGQLAIKALNAACSELHSGEDGIPKTWSEVNIEVITSLNYK